MLTTDQESEHRRLRAAFNAFFNMKNIEAVLRHMAGACQQEMTRLQAAARAGGAGSVDVDVAAVSARLMDDLVWKVCSTTKNRLYVIVVKCVVMSVARTLMLWLQWEHAPISRRA